jgi:Type IIA topoisomerase (DNA gyrase/topo II, topoisomerase IV), A subunit
MNGKKSLAERLDSFDQNIIEKPIERVLPDSMMPYSEYVIMDRALPRVEDGLKPVQRRILYTMHGLDMKPDGPYKKSARVVGECLGKYHPHGDKSVYDAMVRMAQDFNMRMTLVDGHGNFGSIDGDEAAAMRYTEVRLAPLATELVRDIGKDTVRWNKNFDDTLEEPDVLPGRFPNLLVNGATGIAIGLATNIPSHNLSETIDGCIAMIDRPDIALEELVKIIKGPDFPTGGFLIDGGAVLEAYKEGRGKLVLRAKADVENEGERQNIVVTEIPYNVNKEALQKRIYELKDSKKDILGNISEVADESDRNGMRIVVKLKKGEDAVKILNYLFEHTDLQTNFNVNMVAIAAGKPRQMGLVEILKYYLEFQKSVILRRSKYEIDLAKKRAHILEGYAIVIPNIDRVIEIIRNAPTRPEANKGLRQEFGLDEVQAEAILSLQLGNINRLDAGKFERELGELKGKISELQKIISSQREQYAVVRRELEEIKNRYKVKRLTTIVDSLDELEIKPFDPTKRTAKKGFIVLGGDGNVKLVSGRNYLAAVRDAGSSGADGLAACGAKCDTGTETIIFREPRERLFRRGGIGLRRRSGTRPALLFQLSIRARPKGKKRSR